MVWCLPHFNQGKTHPLEQRVSGRHTTSCSHLISGQQCWVVPPSISDSWSSSAILCLRSSPQSWNAMQAHPSLPPPWTILGKSLQSSSEGPQWHWASVTHRGTQFNNTHSGVSLIPCLTSSISYPSLTESSHNHLHPRPSFRLCLQGNTKKDTQKVISMMGNPTWDAGSVEQGGFNEEANL